MERLYGVREGRPEKLPNYSVVTQSDLATQLGISVDTLQNYKLLSDMIPELEDLIDTRIVTKTTALAMMRNLSEDLQDEDSKLRALISNNFGRRKNDPSKDRKALETYVSLRGYKQHDNQWTCQNGTTSKLTLDEIAKELNTSKRNLQRALRIERNLTDSMKELLDSDEITKTLAADTIASMSEEGQEELISKKDITKKIDLYIKIMI